METLALVVEIVTALLTASGIVYGLLALSGVRAFERDSKARGVSGFAPGVSILKPLKGVDSRMYAGFVSHCKQTYAGEWEILFGVSSLDDAAVATVARLRVEHPLIPIRIVECPQRLGPNGKVSTLAQLVPHAAHEYLVVNDSDILVSMHYLDAVINPFTDEDTGAVPVGLVTVPYIGTAEKTLWSRLEALGISTDFMPGVLTARKLEGGIRFGLGSTLATTKRRWRRLEGLNRWWTSLPMTMRWARGLQLRAIALSWRMRWSQRRCRRIRCAGFASTNCAGREGRGIRGGLGISGWA